MRGRHLSRRQSGPARPGPAQPYRKSVVCGQDMEQANMRSRRAQSGPVGQLHGRDSDACRGREMREERARAAKEGAERESERKESSREKGCGGRWEGEVKLKDGKEEEGYGDRQEGMEDLCLFLFHGSGVYIEWNEFLSSCSIQWHDDAAVARGGWAGWGDEESGNRSPS